VNTNHLKIICFYAAGVFCIIAYVYLEISPLIPNLIEEARKGRYKGFGAFFITGLIKYGVLIYGILSIVIMTFVLIKRKMRG